jgi:hypothetical protein
MNAGRAFLSGVAGAAVMSVGLAVGRAMGMPANLELMLGSMLLPPGTPAFMLGLAMHLVIGGLFGLLYAWAFEHVTHRSSAAIGGGLGILHGIAGGVFMGLLPMMHPRIPEEMPAPGAFMANLGTLGVMAEMVLHVVYGAVVGALYQPASAARTVQDAPEFRRPERA